MSGDQWNGGDAGGRCEGARRLAIIRVHTVPATEYFGQVCSGRHFTSFER